jgi:hypothetical protein
LTDRVSCDTLIIRGFAWGAENRKHAKKPGFLERRHNMRSCKKERRFVAVLTWFLLVGGGILFLGCDQVQGLPGIGDEEGGNNEDPDVPPPPVAFGTYYVAASSNDTNGGTSEFPLQTVEGALGRLATDYAHEDWPDKGDLKEGFGEIIIRGTVTASSTILVDGPAYPSIVLRGESGGTSKLVWSGATATDYLLKITNGARITLEKDLTLTRTTANGAMVYVDADGAFTMNSGDIAGDSLLDRGVYVDEKGVFTMNEGTISGNSAGTGGGVGVYKGAFTMNRGTISGNEANYGGGVYMSGTSGTFLKNLGGIIYGANEDTDTNKNTANNKGHAVYVQKSSGDRKRDNTAGEGISLYSEEAGFSGGWDE